jgi:hypothetical protein
MVFYNELMKGSNKKVTLNDLAGMVKRGFGGVDKRFDILDIENIRIKAKLVNLEHGQEEIRLRMDKVAYAFEVKELDRRLKRVEQKLGMNKVS